MMLDLIEAHHQRWGDSSTMVATFGAIDAEEVASWYERACVATLRSPPTRGLFFGASAGCVAGIELADGREVVIKAYQPRWRLDALQAVSAAQQRLSGAGFACPVPVLPPLQFEDVAASIDFLLPDPGMRLLDMDEMAHSAGSLAQATSILRDEDASPWVNTHAMDRPSGSLYPIPHNPLFDFTLKAEEAAWIDELATAALDAQNQDDTPPQMLHGDWSARNIRIVDHRLVASYDWDSLGAFRESKGVGIAAATWRSNGERNDPPAPDSDEINRYLEAYVEVAGGSRGRKWRTAAMGSALYTLAYTARCEHSLEAQDPHYQARRARDTLAADHDGFLNALNDQ
jgi:hypothetical protein